MWHEEKKRLSSSHFSTRCRILISNRDRYNLYLSGSLGGKEHDRKTILHRRIRITRQYQKYNIYFTHFLCYYRLETITPRLWFVFLKTFLSSWSQIWLPFFLLEKCILALQPCISVLAYPLGYYYFDCQYLKHYSMTLLCSKMDFILSSSPPP